ncbi:MAG: hypothetical protein D4R92_04875 [Actinobacteria bacterium]|nr:MAG: hypothetical protein D4R92_04875 [Actinomycetota bacterium]
MHPIEHLRYVARARGADPVSLVRETAAALGGLSHEPAGIVLAVRRIVQRHPTTGPLWWLCSHVLGANDPFEAIRRCEEQIETDSTVKTLRDALPQDAVVCIVGWPTATLNAIARRVDLKLFVVESNGDGDALVDRLQNIDVDATLVQHEFLSRIISQCDVVIIEALATGARDVLCSGGSHSVAALAYCEQKPVWLVTPCGTRLPEALWTGMLADVSADIENPFDVVPVSLVTQIISPNGVSQDITTPFIAECPPTTELLRRSAM